MISRTPQGAGKTEIDATGLVVALGIIDIHSHSDHVIPEDGRAESKVRQGVTTDVLGEGKSSGPYHGSASKLTASLGRGTRSFAALVDVTGAV